MRTLGAVTSRTFDSRRLHSFFQGVTRRCLIVSAAHDAFLIKTSGRRVVWQAVNLTVLVTADGSAPDRVLLPALKPLFHRERVAEDGQDGPVLGPAGGLLRADDVGQGRDAKRLVADRDELRARPDG